MEISPVLPTLSGSFGALPGAISSSPTLVYAIYGANRNGAARYLQVFNGANGPSGVPSLSFLVPAGNSTTVGTDFFTLGGAEFPHGLSLGMSTTSGTYTAATGSESDWAVSRN